MPAPLAAVLLSKVLLLKLAVLLPVTVRPPPWLLDALLPVKLDPCSHQVSECTAGNSTVIMCKAAVLTSDVKVYTQKSILGHEAAAFTRPVLLTGVCDFGA